MTFSFPSELVVSIFLGFFIFLYIVLLIDEFFFYSSINSYCYKEVFFNKH